MELAFFYKKRKLPLFIYIAPLRGAAAIDILLRWSKEKHHLYCRDPLNIESHTP